MSSAGPRATVLLPRRWALLGVLPALGLAAPLALLLLDGEAAPAGAPSPARAPAQGPPADAAARVADARRSPDERALALRELVAASADAGPVLALLERLDGPAHAQARAMALTALARWPDDPRARACLLRVAETGPRDERLVAVGVLCELAGEWRLPLLRRLESDDDPAVRDRVRSR